MRNIRAVFKLRCGSPTHPEEREWEGLSLFVIKYLQAAAFIHTHRAQIEWERGRQREREGGRKQSAEGSIKESSNCTGPMPAIWIALCFCLCVYVLLVGIFACTLAVRGRSDCIPILFDLPPLSFPYPPLTPSLPLGELLPAPWWRRKACLVVAVSPRAAGQHRFDLHTRTDANSSAMPRSGAITSCHPSRCQVGAQWRGTSRKAQRWEVMQAY